MPKVKGAPTVEQKLAQFGEDKVIDLIHDGYSLTHIARKCDVARSALCAWIDAKSDRSARVKLARMEAADAYADKAEDALLEAGDTPIALQRARELAHHYRWVASKRNPGAFGDRMKAEVEHSGSVDVSVSIEQAKAIAEEFRKLNET